MSKLRGIETPIKQRNTVMGFFNFFKRDKEENLKAILLKMGMPSNEFEEFKRRTGGSKYVKLAKIADELIIRESKRIGRGKVEVSLWGIEQINEMVITLWDLMRIVGPKLYATSNVWLPIVTKEGGGSIFRHMAREAVEDVIREQR